VSIVVVVCDGDVCTGGFATPDGSGGVAEPDAGGFDVPSDGAAPDGAPDAESADGEFEPDSSPSATPGVLATTAATPNAAASFDVADLRFSLSKCLAG
jgi:hypothetical protein